MIKDLYALFAPYLLICFERAVKSPSAPAKKCGFTLLFWSKPSHAIDYAEKNGLIPNYDSIGDTRILNAAWRFRVSAN